jgi:endonuclease-3 related protein
MPTAAVQLRHYYRDLFAAYGPQHWWPARTPFEVAIGAILTQNTAWTAVERSIVNLRAAKAITLAGLVRTSEANLRELIRPSGHIQRKAATLLNFALWFKHEHRGSFKQLAMLPMETTRAQLLALHGIGPETADCILLYALHHPAPVVDEYLRRVTTRHSLAPANASYEALRQLTATTFANATKGLNEFHALIVQVGKSHCRTRPVCDGCPLAKYLKAPLANL